MYDVGQVVFVISDKHKRVIPVLVVEQVVRRTLDGETVEYQVQGDSSKKQTYVLSAIGTNHFSSAEDVRKYMCENATTTIDEIVSEALQIAQTKFSYQEEPTGLVINTLSTPVDAPDIFVNSNSSGSKAAEGQRARVKLPDGTYANVNVSIPGL